MNKKSILIVDDEESIRVSLDGFLKNKYYVQTAKSGSIALEKLQNNHYDLILSDIKMDDMNGILLLKKIKEKFPRIPILLMTGYSSLNTAIEALRLGASDYLIKPYVKKIVFESIARCLKNNSKKNINPFLIGTVPEAKGRNFLLGCALSASRSNKSLII